MSKFPVYTPEEIIRILKINGFMEDRQKGSHKVFYNAKTLQRVVVPCHKKDLPIGTARSILKMAGLLGNDE
ncbi:type II toxin-antitoxin system HicA family toxin [Candidatus Peregrinibacteria bacterium]|nr:type II toxin-antitoxin system HicA family toxin [Candidatus Peregrinibacteria bacterium]